MMDLFLWLEGTALSTWIRESPSLFAFAGVLTSHTFGMAVLVGASTVLNLRVLGVVGSIPFAPLRMLFPVIWAGFGLNLVTGTLLFAADATSRGTQWMFFVKMLFVAVGVTTVVLVKRQVYDAKTEPVVVSGAAKRLAILSLVAWVVAITSGRLLAYVR